MSCLEIEQIIRKLREAAVPKNKEGMARYGIETSTALGVSIPVLRKMAKEIGTNHALALKLWKTDIHEARLLASMIDDPASVTPKQMESWVKDFDSWDVCDQCVSNLFDRTPFAYKKAVQWAGRSEEFVKRAGFVLMAALSVHDKKAKDSDFETFFALIQRESFDERNFVKKAVNWALRQIGKRNAHLHVRALDVAHEIETYSSKAARWIARDAVKELTSEKVHRKINKIEENAK